MRPLELSGQLHTPYGTRVCYHCVIAENSAIRGLQLNKLPRYYHKDNYIFTVLITGYGC